MNFVIGVSIEDEEIFVIHYLLFKRINISCLLKMTKRPVAVKVRRPILSRDKATKKN
jgi:hypothetical protein